MPSHLLNDFLFKTEKKNVILKKGNLPTKGNEISTFLPESFSINSMVFNLCVRILGLKGQYE
jgi:hypothetical protein